MKVLKLRVGIEGLEEKIWREVEVLEKSTVADLAYTILATFNSLAYHLYDVEHKGKTYDCGICIEEAPDQANVINATITEISSMSLEKEDMLKMTYDYGSTNTFNIKVLDIQELEKVKSQDYPKIVAGEGLGMLDDIADFELKEIVEDTDKKGESKHYFTPGYELDKYYDYREFDLEANNLELKKRIEKIKAGYEMEEEEE